MAVSIRSGSAWPDWSPVLNIRLRRVALLGVALLLPGCTTMMYAPPPSDFPRLRVEEHALPHVEFKDKCAAAVRTGHHVATGAAAFLMGASLPYAALAAAIGPTVDACAEMDFTAGVCHVYYSADFPPGEIIMRHEREGRCRGHDNPGDRAIRDAWAAYKLHQRDVPLWREFSAQRETRNW
jgi:hypothetical protein